MAIGQVRIDVTHKRLMQQNCVETLQSDRESLIQELSLRVGEEIDAILWPKLFRNFTADLLIGPRVSNAIG